MTSVLSIFNPSFLMFLGFIIIIALLIFYYENKMRDQNHKIASMLSLVSSLAEELNIVKIHLNHINFIKGGGIASPMLPSEMSNEISMNISETNSLGENLIPVSDDEEDEKEDYEDDD
jgi:phosphoglycerol transferase MdoB-like AlkP superfamily enzyme